jgi:hypothetical protein
MKDSFEICEAHVFLEMTRGFNFPSITKISRGS